LLLCIAVAASSARAGSFHRDPQVLDAYAKIAHELPLQHLTAASNVSRQFHNKFENPDSPNNQIELQIEVSSDGGGEAGAGNNK
jgi:hypothetical protein